MCIGSMMPSNHLILCHPLLLLPSIFPSIRVFSNESVLHIRWPKYWSFISGSLAAQTKLRTESTRFQGPLAGFCIPTLPEADPWVPRKCVRDVGSLALSSPAETCAGGWGLILRVWVPAHGPKSGEAAPEARPAGGALRARLIGESTASSVASLLGRRGGSRAQSRGKPCLHGAKRASSTAEL